MSERRSTLDIPAGKLVIVSGGQTGVDQAALDAALQTGLPTAGWCPRGRRCETGRISRQYPLQETPAAGYAVRTEWNVRDSDGTLIVVLRHITGGTALTVRLAEQYGRPLHIARLLQNGEEDENLFQEQIDTVVDWLKDHKIRVLNVAGPRGSSDARVYPLARRFCEAAFSAAAAVESARTGS